MDDVPPSRFSAPVRLRIDYDALVGNWRVMAKASGAAQTGAAVKADAYGLGARDVVKHLSAAGCQDFFVAHWQEAAEIADIVPPDHISVLNGVSPDDVQAAISLGAIPVLNTPSQIQGWKVAGGGKCHVMLDTGINRLGIGPEQISSELLDGLDVDILMSHLASADEDALQNVQQLKLFRELSTGITSERRSFANSAGIMLGNEYHFDLTRPGLALYGGIARPEMASIIKQVAYPQARILQVRTLKAGDPVGYNGTFNCKQKTRVATASIGYADGYRRAFSSVGTCTFEGAKLPILGRVSMDLITIDAGNALDLSDGDWVDIEYDLQDAAHTSGLSQYELLTGLGQRFVLE
jgi:alanine racemase